MSKTNDFFEDTNDTHNNACVNFSWNPNYGYAMGYKKAADFLAENAVDYQQQDFLVYPTVFLYRHYIELRLKHIIDYGRQFLDTGKDFPKHHGINDLWGEAKKILIKIAADITIDNEFKITENVIYHFNNIDPKSMAFRYPTDKKGEKHLDGLRYINLIKLAKNMGKVENFLESSLCMLLEHLSLKEVYENAYTINHYF